MLQASLMAVILITGFRIQTLTLIKLSRSGDSINTGGSLVYVKSERE